jgi:biotin synthase
MNINCILNKNDLNRNDLIALLSAEDPLEIEAIRNRAEELLVGECGISVYFRGLIEFSNICKCDCLYCGIRMSNTEVKRYQLDKKDVVSAAVWCAGQGYGSIVLQSGERNDKKFVEDVVDLVKTIKAESRSDIMPDGLGITLCVGEQSTDTYKRFFDAGAHRYLLRIETSSEKLFSQIHPSTQSFANRVRCLEDLKKIGFQLGTGVMIGLPGQTVENLADDILFFRSVDTDMIGMGPFIVHSRTPMSNTVHDKNEMDRKFNLSLRMIAATRIMLKDVNIAATTALQALKADGREQGLRFGANVIMPQLTPTNVRKDYLLYEGKPCLEEGADHCKTCLERRIESIGRKVAYNKWGDPVHYMKSENP